MEEKINCQQREIDDLFIATFKISNFDDENETFHDTTTIDQSSINENLKGKDDGKIDVNLNVPNPNASEKKINAEMEESASANRKDETPTETIDSEWDIKYHMTSIGDTHKMTQYHAEEYMKKLNYISETAKLCVANYKVNACKFKISKIILKPKNFERTNNNK